VIQRHALHFVEGKLTINFSISKVCLQLIVEFLHCSNNFREIDWLDLN